jgi:Right handed beta helix region
MGLLYGMLFPTAHAQQTIQVPADAPTVQAAINMANTGDTVNIAPGTYTGQINFSGKSITVQGSAAGVILQGSLNGPVVTFASGETRSAILQNVTITNGAPTALPGGGGIFINGASPTIQNSIIQNNQECAIGVMAGAPAILNNEISGTTFTSKQGGCTAITALGIGAGGAILLDGTSADGLDAQIIGNTIENNQVALGSPGINVISAGMPLIENNIIQNNLTGDRGGGIFVYGNTAPLIVQNLIYNNTINPGPVTASSGVTVGAGLNLDILTGNTGDLALFPVLIVNNSIVGNQLLLAPGANAQGSQLFAQDQIQTLQLYNNLIIGSTSQAAIDCVPPPKFVRPPGIPGPLARSDAATVPAFAPAFTNNDIYNLGNPGAATFAGICSDPTGTDGNISADPLFATVAGDPHPYELQLASPAVDSGDNAAPVLPPLDILGQPRIQNAKGLSTAIVDMGVYEYPGVPGSPPPPPTFTLTVNPSAATVLLGTTTNLTVTLTPSAANFGPVQFACIGLPTTISCAFTPSPINLTTTSSQTSQLALTAAAPPQPIASAQASPAHTGRSITLAGCLFLPLLLAFKPKSPKKKLPRALCLGITLLLISSAGLSGCGKDQFISLIKPQTYNFIVQGTATNFNETQQAQVTLTVAQAI